MPVRGRGAQPFNLQQDGVMQMSQNCRPSKTKTKQRPSKTKNKNGDISSCQRSVCPATILRDADEGILTSYRPKSVSPDVDGL